MLKWFNYDFTLLPLYQLYLRFSRNHLRPYKHNTLNLNGLYSEDSRASNNFLILKAFLYSLAILEVSIDEFKAE